MKFGPVPVAQAEGAILAHSVRLEPGRLRKGVVLGADHLAALSAAGVSDVVVARLEATDVHEDPAAQALAGALVPDEASAGIDIRAVGTGRVNLLSGVCGVLDVDATAVHAVNAAHPMITLATVPPWQQMDPSGMVATVKIISYGVDQDHLNAACDAGRAALRMRAPVFASAGLIQTVAPGEDGAKGHRHIFARLDRLGVPMAPKTCVSHQAAALAEAIRACSAEVILILTTSATSDIADIAPSAVVAAGGQITHFGMPVDPGNLLFLGDVAGKPVIGLPGCARSPALNGADWVLSRVICGVPVTSADIAGMGVGGLLKEIPTRPQPRNG